MRLIVLTVLLYFCHLRRIVLGATCITNTADIVNCCCVVSYFVSVCCPWFLNTHIIAPAPAYSINLEHRAGGRAPVPLSWGASRMLRASCWV